MNSSIDHVFLLFAVQIFFGVSAIFVTVSQCAKKKATNAAATPASAPPPVGVPLVSTATGVGPSVNTALPPAADAKSGMKKPEEKKRRQEARGEAEIQERREEGGREERRRW
ncbi:hypothetical protein M3Y94_01225900 [Aphelenchoides besseyi]|nr:hypothetical protein M3Y94_01225900 [Aphelenchoides besseyi]